MRHYHGTPIGGPIDDAYLFIKGRCVLIPYIRQDNLAIAMDVAESFILDSSTFSYWKSGKGRAPFAAYVELVRSVARHPGFDFCFIPDIIDGDEAENWQLVREWMESKFKFQGVPVWHLHESLEYLAWLVENFHTIAVGSSGQWDTPGTLEWWQRMAQAMEVICDEEGRPRCKIHGLRMLSWRIVEHIPLSSADSTDAAVNGGSVARFGTYRLPTSVQRSCVIADIIESHNSPAVWRPYGIQQAMAI